MNPFGDLENYVGSAQKVQVDPFSCTRIDVCSYHVLLFSLFEIMDPTLTTCVSRGFQMQNSIIGLEITKGQLSNSPEVQHFPKSCCFPVSQEGMMIPQLVMLLGGQIAIYKRIPFARNPCWLSPFTRSSEHDPNLESHGVLLSLRYAWPQCQMAFSRGQLRCCGRHLTFSLSENASLAPLRSPSTETEARKRAKH